MSASNYLENKILDHVLTTTSYTAPGTRYIALFTGSAATNLEAGILTNEIPSGRGYTRQSVTFGTAINGVSANNITVTFGTATGTDWGSITYVAIMDSSTIGAGNVLIYGQVTVAKTVLVGDTFRLSSGNLTITLN